MGTEFKLLDEYPPKLPLHHTLFFGCLDADKEFLNESKAKEFYGGLVTSEEFDRRSFLWRHSRGGAITGELVPIPLKCISSTSPPGRYWSLCNLIILPLFCHLVLLRFF